MKKQFIAIAVLLVCAWSFSKVTIQNIEGTNKLTVYVDQGKETIAPEIYGQFAEHIGLCIYDGFWVGEDSDIPNVGGIRTDVVEALKKLNVPVLRWPGGCFADEYHWKDGIGPHDKRLKMVNTNWGMVTETNAFGTHEFMKLCDMLGCEAYIAGNVGSGTPEEMQEWVEYMTFAGDSEMANLRRQNGRDKPWKIKYFGVGNENWGCGGRMTPEYYADLYKQFATYVRSYPGNRIIRVACGPNNWDTNWMEVVMKRAARSMEAISLHYYVHTGTWKKKGDAVKFNKYQWFELMKMSLDCDKMLNDHIAIMDKYDPKERVALYVDEWATWWDPPETELGLLYRQNTIRDAVSAGVFLNTFNNHCKRVKMCNIAQVNNILQAMILTRGREMIVTPSYHVFEMFKVHQGATLLPCDLTCNVSKMNDIELPVLNVSASKDANGTIHITLCNLDPEVPAELECQLQGARAKVITGRVLTAEAMNAHNTFENPNIIRPKLLKNIEVQKNVIKATVPSKSVVAFEIK